MGSEGVLPDADGISPKTGGAGSLYEGGAGGKCNPPAPTEHRYSISDRNGADLNIAQDQDLGPIFGKAIHAGPLIV